jgi:riboflavin synthase
MQTNVYLKKVGDTLNIECDLIARYVEKLIMSKIPDEAEHPRPVLTEELLRLSGFIGGEL